ncbi:MAG TPA: RodZ domain-containing protein [Vicinamibacterales bacterium]|nr:RodZ domain-containing protein [Vicinamibacterales bacterium]
MERGALGQKLKQAREARGLTLREIETATKISVPTLEALERGELSKLPGGIYSRSFVRAYAAKVGLDPEECAREFVAELSMQEREAASVRIRPAITDDDRAFLARQQRALRLARVAAIAGAILVVAAIAWAVTVWWPASGATPEETTPPAPVTRQAPTPPPPADPVATRSQSGTQAGRDRLTLTIEVTADCWVQATADGLVVLSRLLRAGDRETLVASRELQLDVGNAGALRWTINGEPAQSLGRDGRRRQVTITRENASSFLR